MFVVLLAAIVLLPGEDHGANGIVAAAARLIADWGLPYGPVFNVLEFTANIALFMPVGLLLPVALGALRPRHAVLTVAVGFVLSGAIEFSQRFIAGRVSDPRDLISNTLGTALGILLLYLFGVARGQTPPSREQKETRPLRAYANR